MKTKLQAFGQEHLLTYWDALAPFERECLARQIEQIDFALLADLYRDRDKPVELLRIVDRAGDPPAYKFSTVPSDTPPCRAEISITAREATEAGQAALQRGEVAAIVVAGGQGTRLGFPHPKGMFPVGPVSNATLFQIHFEKVLAMSMRYGKRIPYCVMTSPATDSETHEFLETSNRFGMSPDDVYIFQQGTLPAISLDDGKVLLETKSSIALSPDGHGGMLAALARPVDTTNRSLLQELKQRGIKYLFYHQVDNPLVQIGSPEYLGYHILSGSELTSQVIRKQTSAEKVGNVVDIDGRLHIIEYSDLPKFVGERTNDDGTLKIWAGSIAVHVFNLDLLLQASRDTGSLPFHIAKKKVPFLNVATGRQEKPATENAIKFERFIFDLLPLAKNAIVVEVDKANHYGPLKNATGSPEYSPETVRRDISAFDANRLRQVGALVASNVTVEISPLYAESQETLAAKTEPGTVISTDTYLK